MGSVARLLILLLGFLFAGCGSAVPMVSVSPKISTVDVPRLGVLVNAELGETLVRKGKIYEYDAIELHNSVSLNFARIGSSYATLEPCKLIAVRRKGEYVYYGTDKLTYNGAYTSGGLIININDSKDVRGYLVNALPLTPEPKPKPNAVFSMTKVVDVNSPSFIREIIYNGRNGDALRFIYREFSGSVIRASYTQEIQYDLSDGNVIGFKGARIEVVEATNTKISYRVLSGFNDVL